MYYNTIFVNVLGQIEFTGGSDGMEIGGFTFGTSLS